MDMILVILTSDVFDRNMPVSLPMLRDCENLGELNPSLFPCCTWEQIPDVPCNGSWLLLVESSIHSHVQRGSEKKIQKHIQELGEL